MIKKHYRIETKDGYVVRKKATRAYKFGFVVREGEKATGGHTMTSGNPKHALGETYYNSYWKETSYYEELIAIEI